MIPKKLSLAAAVMAATAETITACGAGENQSSDLSTITVMAPFLEAQPPSADGAVQN